ncbi:MAG: hypothetical protein DSY47_04895 [Hydrogenothermus sp.]|nr:MAG: hypothetical protein DSY47_04895 [Hydrogenothermus sp.]
MNKKLWYVSIIVILFSAFASFWGIKLYGATKAEKEFKNFVQSTNLDKFYDIKVENFDFNPFTREFIFKNLHIKPKFAENQPIEIEELRLKFEELKDGFVFSLKTEDLKSKYENKQISQDGKLILKYKNKVLEFKDESKIENYFRLKTELELENFDSKIFSLLKKLYRYLIVNLNNNLQNTYPYLINDEDFILLISKLAMVIPEDIEVEYEERGFSEILLENLAKETGKDKEFLRKELIKDINKEIKREKNENLKKLLEAFAYFLENKKGKLKVEIENKDSLSFQDIIALYVANRDANLVMNKLSDKITIKVEFEK